MAKTNAFPCLLQRIFVPMNLGQDGTELHLKARDDDEFAHSITNGTFLKVEVVHAEVVEGLIYAAGTLLKHLHLLIAERHIVEHDEKMKLVAPASLEIYHVHDPVGLLKKVQGSLVLFTLDKAVCTVVQLGQHDRDLVLRDA